MRWQELAAEAGVIALLVAGVARFRTPHGARFGNHAAALALVAAVALVLSRHGIHHVDEVIVASLVGALGGMAVAVRVNMTRIPAVIALQHGVGGVAAVLVSAVELARGGAELAPVAKVSGLLGLALGAATFSASLLAAAKLADRLKQAPVRVQRHGLHLAGLAFLVVVMSVQYAIGATAVPHLIAAAIAASLFGALVAIRIGGADMPVLISFLNAAAGFAAAFCGVTIGDRLLIVVGATIASSGCILTIMMCRAMNRSLVGVFRGGVATAVPVAKPAPVEVAAAPTAASPEQRLDAVARLALDARTIVIVPGYGMALAHAQFEVVTLARRLEALGKDVRFAIHPVAGRMPGHMNVLLAEADVDYEKLCEMDDVNPAMPSTDLVLVIGACDVVNPAAIDIEGTPLSGMPILMAHEARAIAVCNLDDRPGYSGVPNPLYGLPKTSLLLGDALHTVEELAARIEADRRC